MNLEHLYIHWPFCLNKCKYCDFVSFVKHEDYKKDYHKSLLKEIKLFSENLKNKFKIKTIYMGGGTPNSYPLDLLEELVITLKKNFNLENIQEFTIEVNPAGVTENFLETYKKLGINRLSIGVQILDNKILKDLNRFQTEQDVFDLLEIAPKYFDNISVDLILGLPGSNSEIWNYTLNKLVLNKNIKHISVYILTIYEHTQLYHEINSGKIKLITEDELIDLYKNSVNFLQEYSFEQYEISNFAKQGYRSIHNIAYWQRKEYKGFGLAAASFDGQSRYINENNLIKYVNNIKNKLPVCYLQEKLTEKQVFLERLMLGLRQKDGLDLQGMLYFLSDSDQLKFLNKLTDLESKKLIQIIGGRVFLTLEGMLLENEVVLSIF